MNIKPEWEPLWLACRSCKHEWDDWQPVFCRIDTWIAHVRSLHCPACGTDRRDIVMRRLPLPEAPADD